MEIEHSVFPNEMGFEIVSQMNILPASQLGIVYDRIYAEFSGSNVLKISMTSNDSWNTFCDTIGKFLKFPNDVCHSFQAFIENVADLSWLSGEHYIVFLDISQADEDSSEVFHGINALLNGLILQNCAKNAKITVLVFV